MLEWEYSLTVPSGVMLTDETVDAFIQGFHPDGTAKERSTANGTYPSETSWDDSRYAIPEAESFGTKRIPGTDPFYFCNQEEEDGKVYAHFGHLEAEELPEIMVGSGALIQTFDNYPEMNSFVGDNRDKSFYALIRRGKKIPRGAFSGLSNVTTVVFQTTVVEIGDNAFTGSGISSIDLSTVRKIGISAFENCNSLRSVHVPGTVKIIPEDAFRSCPNLTSAQFDEGIEVIETRAFGSCFLLESVALPEGLTSIGAGAFAYCNALKTVSMPNSVTTMDENAFDDCEDLETINLSTGLTELKAETFQRCFSLHSLVVPSSILSIDSTVFNHSGLETIYINRPTNSISGSPWGATNATVIWTG